MILYHATSREAVKAILANGFRNGEDGFCWFSPVACDIEGPLTKQSLLRVRLNLTSAEIKPYEHIIIWETVCDEDGIERVDVDDAMECPRPTWYAIPESVVKDRMTGCWEIVGVKRRRLLEG